MILNLKEVLLVFLFYIFRIFQIQNNKIVVCSYLGQGYGDNGKYIVQELLAQNRNYDIVWLVRDMNERFPDGIRSVKYNTLASIYEQVTAKVWIDNRRKPGYVRKRKNQFYLMTWHAGIGLKRCEKDAQESLSANYIRASKNDSKMADLFLSDSKWTTEQYRRNYWYSGEILEKGLPREDILFLRNEDVAKKIKKELGIKDNVNVLMYAPTFRKEKSKESLELYKLDWENLLQAFENRFGGEWIGLIRLHPNITSLASELELPKGILDVSNYSDMQELLMISDCLISDYSSCILDFGLTGRKAFIYAKDIEEYAKDRNFLFDIKKLPFKYAESMEALLEIVITFNQDSYSYELSEFYESCGLFEGGNASKYVADYIKDVIYTKSN